MMVELYPQLATTIGSPVSLLTIGLKSMYTFGTLHAAYCSTLALGT